MSSETKYDSLVISEDPSSDPLICLGEIVGHHGIRGGVRIKSFTKDPISIFDYPTLFDAQGKIYKIKYFATKKNGVFAATIQGITTCNQAEALRGTKLHVKRSQLPATSDDEFYHTDLVGLRVITVEGEDMGIISAVQNHGAGDFLDIKSDTGEFFTLLFTKEAVPEIHISKGHIIVDKTFLLNG